VLAAVTAATRLARAEISPTTRLQGFGMELPQFSSTLLFVLIGLQLP
jgi:hypothetical protein